MFRRLVAAVTVLALPVGLLLSGDQGFGQQPKKDAPAKDAKKDAPKDGKKDGPKDGKKDDAKKDDKPGVGAKVLKVDAAKMTAQVQTDDGKKLDLAITEDTKFIGPRGGVSDKGIKDDRFVVGSEIRVVLSGKKVTEIHLPYRTDEKDKPKDEGKAKDKAKDKK